ncbi:hypothetical protein Tco_0631664 [Tanacetum coccineum]
MENEHELSYETLTRVYLGSYEHYKSVGAVVEYLEPGFELQGAKMDHMGAKDCCLMGLRKKRCGASCNEGFEVLFIVKIIKEAKIAYGFVMGRVEQLGGDVLKLHDES